MEVNLNLRVFSVAPPTEESMTKINGIIKLNNKEFTANLTIKTHEEYLSLAGQVLSPVSISSFININNRRQTSG